MNTRPSAPPSRANRHSQGNTGSQAAPPRSTALGGGPTGSMRKPSTLQTNNSNGVNGRGAGGPQTGSKMGGGPPPGSKMGGGPPPGSKMGGGPSESNGSFYGGMGERTGSMRSMGSMGGSAFGGMGNKSANGSFYGGMAERNGSMRGSAYGMQNAAGGPMGSGYGGFGSMRSMNSGYGSMYGAGGGPMGGSMYGMGGGPMGGSMYGTGGGSMYGMGGGSMYGMGGGSMYGMGGGSMYGMGGGSMYGMGGGSMYGMGGGSMYGSIVDAASRRDGFLARNGLVRAEIAPIKSDKDKNKENKKDENSKTDKASVSKDSKEKSAVNSSTKDSKSANTNATSTSKDSKEDEKAAPRVITSNSLQSAKTPATTKTDSSEKSKIGDSKDTNVTKNEKDSKDTKSKTIDTDTKSIVKPPTDNNIHSLMVVVKESESTSSAAFTVKNATTITNSSKEEYILDEVITHKDTSKNPESVMLEDLRRHWLAGHNSSLLIGASKGHGEDSVKLASHFLSNAMSKVEKDSPKFDVTISVVAVKGDNEAKDLLISEDKYEKMQLASSPIYGPAVSGVANKVVSKGSECVSTLEESLKKSKEPKELVLAFFVLKQVKKSSTNEDTVYLSSLCMVFAKEDVSHFTGIKDKSKSEPFNLLRYSVGGASTTVCMLLVSSDGKEKESVKTTLNVGKAMREVKNSPPRSGNVKNFVEFTKKELPKQKESIEKLSGNTQKQEAMKKIVSRMEIMLKDAEELLSKPMETKAKVY